MKNDVSVRKAARLLLLCWSIFRSSSRRQPSLNLYLISDCENINFALVFYLTAPKTQKTIPSLAGKSGSWHPYNNTDWHWGSQVPCHSQLAAVVAAIVHDSNAAKATSWRFCPFVTWSKTILVMNEEELWPSSCYWKIDFFFVVVVATSMFDLGQSLGGG